jgi:ABC-type lipoprotein export system ATPase subunit
MFPRGSQWRRWDLHIHTKGTAKNDQFTSDTFDDFCIDLFRKAIDKEIAVIGITDYFAIENYRKVVDFVRNIDTFTNTNTSGQTIFSNDDKQRIKEIFILPNVELRMMPSTNSGRLVNIHCLFNPEFLGFIENDFFGSIEYSAGTATKFKMNRQGMIGLGKSLDSSLNEEVAYKKGLANFVVSHGDLQALYDNNKNFRNNVVIVVSNSNNDGASAFQQHYDLFENNTESQLDAVRKSIYCISHAVFSSNPEDRKYFLGERVDNEEVVSEKCGSLKPCIHGSDAHTEDKLFNPNNNLYCWIKADPTFEGLKQIIWDPKERVRIQERNPADSKSGRIIIDNITYKDGSGQVKTVPLNQDLNSIIGTRGSGKSTLLKNIASKVDPIQFSEKDKFDKLYNLDEFKVHWGDGEEDHGNDDSPKNVFYIPQNYLSSLAYEEEDKAQERDKFLTKLLKKHIRFANAIQSYEEFVSNSKIQIEGQIQDLLSANSTLIENSSLLKKQGSKKEIEGEISNKNDEIKKYKGSGDQAVTEKELEDYSAAKKTASESSDKIIILNQDRTILDALQQNETNVLVTNQEFNRLSIKRQEALREELTKKGRENLTDLIKTEIAKIDQEIKTLNKIIVDQNKIIGPLDKKIKANKALEGLTKELADLQIILSKINEYTEKIKQATAQKTEAIGKLVDSYANFDNQQQAIFGTAQFDDTFSFLKIETVTVYNSNDLKRFVERNINTRDSDPQVKQEEDIVTLFSESPIKPSEDTIKKVIVGLVDGKIKTKVEVNDVSQVISQLLKNRYEIDYLNSVKTKDENTHFKDMTGGQKAIALLELVFNYDDEKYPILIDQPEDDLDVVGVATDLVRFVKQEKEERQIIIVSHNASLVVCADTEEVLVSESHRQENGKYDFSYQTGAIEDLNVRDEIIRVLEGGKAALKQRARKLNFKHEI